MTCKIALAEYDPDWPELFRREADRIKGSLGSRALSIEHAGSTAVPGLPAKPIIDILLEVENSADEHAWAPQLEEAGYRCPSLRGSLRCLFDFAFFSSRWDAAVMSSPGLPFM